MSTAESLALDARTDAIAGDQAERADLERRHFAANLTKAQITAYVREALGDGRHVTDSHGEIDLVVEETPEDGVLEVALYDTNPALMTDEESLLKRLRLSIEDVTE